MGKTFRLTCRGIVEEKSPDLCLSALFLWQSELGKVIWENKKFMRNKKLNQNITNWVVALRLYIYILAGNYKSHCWDRVWGGELSNDRNHLRVLVFMLSDRLYRDLRAPANWEALLQGWCHHWWDQRSGTVWKSGKICHWLAWWRGKVNEGSFLRDEGRVERCTTISEYARGRRSPRRWGVYVAISTSSRRSPCFLGFLCHLAGFSRLPGVFSSSSAFSLAPSRFL